MNGCKNEDDCQTPTRCRHLSRCPNASSEEAAAETAGQVSSLALAPGSLPVSSVKRMISTLVHASDVLDDATCPYAAKKLSEMAAELIAELALAESRQPRENKVDMPKCNP